MAVLVIPRHDASGFLPGLEDASADHLVDVEGQAALDHGSSGVMVWSSHVLA
jgi:hypothetical protein